MKIMHTMASDARTKVSRRRFYSPEFKRQVVGQCGQPGASIAALALKHAINANIVHGWLREHSQGARVVRPQAFVPATLGAAPKDREIVYRQAKIDPLTHEMAVLKRWKFGRSRCPWPCPASSYATNPAPPPVVAAASSSASAKIVSEKLDYTPGVLTVERHIRGKWACTNSQTLIQASVPAQIIDKGLPTSGLLAQVLVAKCVFHAMADTVPC